MDGFTAEAGSPLPAGTAPADKASVIEALQTVHDPEIPVNIYDLGLIYDIDIEKDGSVAIVMTLTAPGCPVAGEMPGQVAEAAAGVEGIGEVLVTLTWEPAWTPENMSEDAKLALGMF
jgi:FeS assembly SUF system protein